MYPRIFLCALLVAPLAAACSGGAGSSSTGAGGALAEPWPLDPTTGLRIPSLGPVPPLPEWADNPATDAKKELGRMLFSDPRLSGSGKTVCANCHFPPNEFQSSGPKDAPDRSYPKVEPTLPRNTPSLLNIVYAPMMRWDGSYFTNLDDMGVLPLAEANMDIANTLPAEQVEVVDVPAAQKALHDKLTAEIPGYIPLFQGAFGQDIAKLPPEGLWKLAGQAISVYFRVMVSRDAAFDRWNTGDDSAMSADAIRGLTLFRGRAGCIDCHSGPFFTDFQFHNIATSPPGTDGKRADEGRYLVTKQEKDRGAFLTPTMRSAAMTSPYLHDGSEVSISRVIARKTSPETLALDPNHDPVLDAAPALTDAEVTDIVAFIKALRGAPLPAANLAPPQKLP